MSSIARQEEFVQAAPLPLRWRCWPAREHPLRAVLVVLAVAAIGLATAWQTGQVHLAWIGAGAMALSLWRFFLPIGYELGPGGVYQSILGRRRHCPWTSIGSYEVFSHGVLFVPRESTCVMDALSGLYLPWSPRPEEVMTHVRRRLGEPLKE